MDDHVHRRGVLLRGLLRLLHKLGLVFSFLGFIRIRNVLLLRNGWCRRKRSINLHDRHIDLDVLKRIGRSNE